MDTSTTENDVVIETNEGEGNEQTETVNLSKSEYEKLNQTLGSLKRELKDYKKAKEETKETPTNQKPDDAILQRVEKLALKTAGIDHSDDVELARKTAQKWGMDLEDVLSDEDFKVKLEKQQAARANVAATSNVRGSTQGNSQAKNTPEYWMAKGTPPTPTDVPDRKIRQSIISAFLKEAKGNGEAKFYNS